MLKLYKENQVVTVMDAWGWGWTQEDVNEVFTAYQREARADSYELTTSLN